MERTLKVTGKGTLSLKPDTIRIIITQSSIEKSYSGAIGESADKKGNLEQAIKRAGYNGEELKTLSFTVESEYESYQGKDKSWKRRLIGYKYTHRMKLEFPAEDEALGRVLLSIANCVGHPEFSIQYTVRDQEEAKNELLAKAIEDSKAKAKVLSSAAGVELADIAAIDYSWKTIDIVSNPIGDIMMADGCSEYNSTLEYLDMEINPDDIEITDTVNIIWNIK